MNYKEIQQEIIKAYKLEDNWDGYGSYPISEIIMTKGLNFISILDDKHINNISDVYCNSNGTLIIDFYGSFEELLQIEIGNNGYSGFKRNQNINQPTTFFEGTDLINDKQIMELLK